MMWMLIEQTIYGHGEHSGAVKTKYHIHQNPWKIILLLDDSFKCLTSPVP
jgi:hypothetical protein